MDSRSFVVGTVCGAAAAATIAWVLEQKRRVKMPARGKPVPGESVASQGVLSRGNVAVITGAASGIGRATAIACAKVGMRIVLADIGQQMSDLENVREECIRAGSRDVFCRRCNVTSKDDVCGLKDFAFEKLGVVHLLMNNAAIQSNGDCGPLDYMNRWRSILDVNFWGVVNGCQVFAPAMTAQRDASVIVNTGSKQGITAPPGDTAYNVSKAGVKMYTEALQHSLRNMENCRTNAFLLIPGWTISMITTNGNKWFDKYDIKKAQDERCYDGMQNPAYAREKLMARGAWPAEKVVDELFKAVNVGAPFYIICQDNETTAAMDNGRMQWTADDLLFRRLPLSRWSSQYKDEYASVSKEFK